MSGISKFRVFIWIIEKGEKYKHVIKWDEFKDRN